ncbi:MAG: murein L,D-transpeptidase catalytic domain family protein [Bdellovibrionales bacterium]
MSFKKALVFLSIMATLTACGDASFDSGSLALKQVPVEDGKENQQDAEEDEVVIDDSEEEEVVVEPEKPEDPKTMTLRDKVLMNSDISETALDNALRFYDDNVGIIRNKKVISVFDITKHSGKRRLYVIDTDNGHVSAIHVAHGKNSDKDYDGVATEFSNTSNSLQSSLGFMLTDTTYQSGKNGYSLKLDGLESRNSNVRKRYVVIHGADYVSPNRSTMGRSYGCPAVSRANTNWYINKVKNGSLLYIYHADHDG